MRTRLTIIAIVLAASSAAVGMLALLMVLLGWLGLAIGVAGATAVLAVYRVLVQPWQHRWGATDEEVGRAMPGDDLIPGSTGTTTRAIGIAAPPEQVWPWLVQLGYGRAGWYSYDWIDNGGHPSADCIVPELQRLEVGDQILMLPGMGPRVRMIQPNQYLVAGDEAGVWCLALDSTMHGCRLVSRWRVNWPLTPATAFWILLSDPGAFIMERRMLKGIKARAERSRAPVELAATTPVRRESTDQQ